MTGNLPPMVSRVSGSCHRLFHSVRRETDRNPPSCTKKHFTIPISCVIIPKNQKLKLQGGVQVPTGGIARERAQECGVDSV